MERDIKKGRSALEVKTTRKGKALGKKHTTKKAA